MIRDFCDIALHLEFNENKTEGLSGSPFRFYLNRIALIIFNKIKQILSLHSINFVRLKKQKN
jgi:hypothetical protein